MFEDLLGNAAPEVKLIRIPEVKKITGLSRPTIYRRMNDDGFPIPVRLGHASAWPKHEVLAYVQRKLGER
jgi:prophage regulatory protein